jgi:hypothetical protein
MAEEVIPIKSTTQLFTEVEDIDRDVIMYTDGSCVMVLQTSAVNFGLLSQKEQESIMLAYAGLLNSLSFPIQLLIRTQHKDITSYLQILEDKERTQTNPKLQQSIHSYRQFIAATVKEKDVLDKKFYVIIPFASIELGLTPNSFIGPKRLGLPQPKERIYERAITVLAPKRDHIIRIMHRVGLKATQLTTQQLLGLLFSCYNPEATVPVQMKPQS